MSSSSGVGGVFSTRTAASSGTLEERLLAMLSMPAEETKGDESEGGFSIASYLNSALSDQYMKTGAVESSNTGLVAGSPVQDLQQQRMAELALQLQLQTQSCHEDIGRIGAELQAILPRCHADVGRIGVGLQGLQLDATTLMEVTSLNQNQITSRRASSDTVDENTAADGSTAPISNNPVSSSLETLSTLHALQANLKRTHEILTAAATWDTTLAEIPTLLAPAKTTTTDSTANATSTTNTASSTMMASNLPQAVQKLAILERGENALRGMPNPEERTAALAKLRVQISNLLSPQLQHALQHMSSRLGPLQQCVSLYSQLNMLETLIQQYVANRPKPLHKAWFDHQPPTAAVAAAHTAASSDGATPLFAEWLPTWFESVLQLLQEERRQASAVFGGPQVVPTILVLVLQEAFRPILSSFTSRLSAAALQVNASNTNVTNLDLVCHLYKATLQFLAMAYETIAACWLDWMETNNNSNSATIAVGSTENAVSTIGGQDGVAMYRKIMSIFKKIVSPFSRYQTTLSELEHKSAQAAYSAGFSRLVQDYLPSNQPQSLLELDDLSKATDGLLLVAQEHLVQHSGQDVLGRFEVLQGGYHALEILDTMDQATNQRIQFLIANLNRLGQGVMGDVSNDSLDEPHVLAALQVLKIAATCQSLVSQLQGHVRHRFNILCEHMTTVVTREKEILTQRQKLEDERFARISASASPAFLIPDSLSPVEINAHLCLDLFAPVLNESKATAALQAAEAALAVLRRLGAVASTNATPPTSAATTIMGQTHSAVGQLSTACHKFVFQVCFSVPQKQLQTMAALSSWKKVETSHDVTDSYGTLPQSYITQVGEHMLALVQALEPFATDSEALEMANQVMHNIRQVAEQPWRDFVTATGLSVESSPSESKSSLVQQLMNGKEIREYAVEKNDAAMDDEKEEEDEEGQGEEDQKVTAFCNAWLDVIGLAVTGRLVERILNIPQLTVKGCEHLKADLDYLQNVLVALGVSGHPHPLLDHVSQVISMDLGSLQARIRQLNSEKKAKSTDSASSLVQLALIAMEERLAAMRGM